MRTAPGKPPSGRITRTDGPTNAGQVKVRPSQAAVQPKPPIDQLFTNGISERSFPQVPARLGPRPVGQPELALGGFGDELDRLFCRVRYQKAPEILGVN